MKYKYINIILVFFASLLLVSCASTRKPEQMMHPDAGFKYRTRFERSGNIAANKQMEFAKTNLGYIEPTLKYNSSSFTRRTRLVYDDDGNIVGTSADDYRSPLSVSMESFMYISDAYTPIKDSLSDSSFVVELVDIPPRFKNGDEGKFSKWVVKNNKFSIPRSMRLNSACRGHIIMDITIDKYGFLTTVKPLLVNDPFFQGLVYDGFSDAIINSPKWEPAINNGEPVETRYLIAVVWGHYRIEDQDSKKFIQIIEDGYDPLEVFLP